MFEFNNRDNKTPLDSVVLVYLFWSFSFRHVLYLVLVILLSTLNMKILSSVCFVVIVNTSKGQLCIKKYGKSYNFSSLQQGHFLCDTDEIRGNGCLKILASASERWYWHQNWQWNKTILFYTVSRVESSTYFVKHVIFNKIGILESCNFVKKCFAKISRRRISNNLEGATVPNICGKTSVGEYFKNCTD